jgi:hypothetical protein
MKKISSWRWAIFIVFAVLFAIVVRPWWLAIVSAAAFCLLAFLLVRRKADPQ